VVDDFRLGTFAPVPEAPDRIVAQRDEGRPSGCARQQDGWWRLILKRQIEPLSALVPQSGDLFVRLGKQIRSP
jgi:hypothetical protein